MSNKRIGTRELLARILIGEITLLCALATINFLIPSSVPATVALLASTGGTLSRWFHCLEPNTQHMFKAFISFLLAIALLMPEYFQQRHKHLTQKALNRRYERRQVHNHSIGLWQNLRNAIVTLLFLNALVEIAPPLQSLGLALGALVLVLKRVVANIFASLIFKISPDRDERLDQGQNILVELRSPSGHFSAGTLIEGTVERVSLTKVHFTSAKNVSTGEYEGRVRLGSWDIYDGIVYYVTRVERSDDDDNDEPKCGRRKTDRSESGFKAAILHFWNMLNTQLLTEWEIEELHEANAKTQAQRTRGVKAARKAGRTKPVYVATAQALREPLFGASADSSNLPYETGKEKCSLSAAPASDLNTDGGAGGSAGEGMDAYVSGDDDDYIEESLSPMRSSGRPLSASVPQTAPQMPEAAKAAVTPQEEVATEQPPAQAASAPAATSTSKAASAPKGKTSSTPAVSSGEPSVEPHIDGVLPKSGAKTDRDKQFEAIKTCRDGICSLPQPYKASLRVAQSFRKTSNADGSHEIEEELFEEEMDAAEENAEEEEQEDDEFVELGQLLGGAEEEGHQHM